MKSAKALLLFACAACCTALAAEPDPYEGNWIAAWGPGESNGAVVTIKDGAGTWKGTRYKKKDPCNNALAPLSVKVATPEHLIFDVKYSVIAGCQDMTVKLKPVDDKTLTGHREGESAGKVTLTRQ